MVLIGYEMNKTVYEKTEVVFKMTWVRKKNKKKKKKKQKKKKKKKNKQTKKQQNITFGYETIGHHSENK